MIIAANWKMNPSLDVAGNLVSALKANNFQPLTRILFAPHPYLIPISESLRNSDIRLGGQDCHQESGGAHTGDVSAEMLKNCGASVVLLGHSERRKSYGETSALIASKARQAFNHGLEVMICLGETLDDRQAGRAEKVVIDQLRISVPDEVPEGKLMIAYEPVWAIGTGKVPSISDIGTMHSAIASEISKLHVGRLMAPIPILYGGSVSAENVTSILALSNVDGGLVGGASLEFEAFDSICESARAIMFKH